MALSSRASARAPGRSSGNVFGRLPDDDGGRMWHAILVGLERSALVIALGLALCLGCSPERRPSGSTRPRDASTADSGAESDRDGGSTGDPMDAATLDGSGPSDTGGVQNDAGVPSDGGPAADAGDPGADAGASGADGGPGMSACNNEGDLAILQTVDVEGQAGTCGLGCITDPNRVMCASDCVSNATGLSAGCSMCFAAAIECTITNCIGSCLDPAAPACQQCQIDNGCRDVFTACSGV